MNPLYSLKSTASHFERLEAVNEKLLEALKDCLEIVAVQNGNLHDDINAVQDAARSAIAEAEGHE